MSLLQSEDLNVWDVCASLGYQATKRDLIEDNPLEKVDIVNLANYLNECLHEIANLYYIIYIINQYWEIGILI